MQHWLKILYNREGRSSADYWQGYEDGGWISDSPGRKSKDTTPRPGYRVDDLVVAFLVDDDCCPAILRVTKDPVWDPDRVDDEAEPGDGDRWACLTEVTLVSSVDIDDAPTLEGIGVERPSVAQKGRIKLEPWQYELAATAIAGGTTPPPPVPEVVEVPVEEQHRERGTVRSQRDVRRFERREQQLVLAYVDHLEAKGDSVCRHRIRVGNGSGAIYIYSDLFNKTRAQLVEAKAEGTRDQVRMAISQLADYVRLLEPRPERAVLLPSRPEPDLEELLRSQDIHVIWPEGMSFSDTAGGSFT